MNIGGWKFVLPTGIHPPGPPPRISIPGIKFGTIGLLPPWSEFTIGSDLVPNFKPSARPSDCTTQTGQICLTTTSYGVTASSTSATQVLSTCATVYGCEATSGPTQTTTTSSTSIEFVCEPTKCGNACAARRDLPTSASTPEHRSNSGKPTIEIDLTAKRPRALDTKYDLFDSTTAMHLANRNLPAPGNGD
jgi:hypothetical protein